MNTASTSSTCNIYGRNSLYCSTIYTPTYTHDLYGDFLNSLEEKTDCSIKFHSPSSITMAKLLFIGYLTEEELRERQDEGRYWEIVQVNDDLYKLYIILDNETVLCVERARNGKHYECIFDIADAQINLPESLRGRYYNYDEHWLWTYKEAVEMRLSGKNWELEP